jgi:hypothetical protein
MSPVHGVQNHLSCIECWERNFPDQIPFRVKQAGLDSCCFCGKPTVSGIYVRANAREERLWCEGVKGYHEDEEGGDD